MAHIRKPFQGIGNVVRFNWHLYLLSFIVMVALFLMTVFFNSNWSYVFAAAGFLVLCSAIFSLFVSWWIYDYSNLYSLNWLDDFVRQPDYGIANINAGFDEFSELLLHRFPAVQLAVFDFYDALPQKEVSIRRAQKAYPAVVSTNKIQLDSIPEKDDCYDLVLMLLAAHEIRSGDDRIMFFKEIHRCLKLTGRLIVVEHLRDWPNFLAFNIGFFHFHSRNSWLKTVKNAGFSIHRDGKITPFLNLFILQKNGNPF